MRSILNRLGQQPPDRPQPSTSGVRIGRDDHREFDGSSPIPPIQRLAQYRSDEDAYRFEDLKPDSLADYPRVYVFVHGWVPGSKRPRI